MSKATFLIYNIVWSFCPLIAVRVAVLNKMLINLTFITADYCLCYHCFKITRTYICKTYCKHSTLLDKLFCFKSYDITDMCINTLKGFIEHIKKMSGRGWNYREFYISELMCWGVLDKIWFKPSSFDELLIIFMFGYRSKLIASNK